MAPQAPPTAEFSLMRILLLLLATVVLSACPHNTPPPKDEIKDPALIRGGIEAHAAQFTTARFKEVVLDYFGEGERVKVRQLILVKAPGFLRVQTRMPGSDEVMSLLVSDGTTFAMHRRDTNDYYSGPATKENIARLLPVDLSARDVSRVMVGGAPWDRFDEQEAAPTVSWDGTKGAYAYAVQRREGGKLVMWVRHQDFAVVELSETNGKGDPVYQYTTEDWKGKTGRALPEFRRFVWPARDLDFSMDVGETQLDIDLPDSLFELEPPPGSHVHAL